MGSGCTGTCSIGQSPPQKNPSMSPRPLVDPRYTELADHRLFEEFLFLDGDFSPGTWEVLVAIPSNDAVIGAMLVLEPRKLLLLNTGGRTMEYWEAFHRWHREQRRVSTHCPRPPTDPDEHILDEYNLIHALERGLGRANRSRVAYLATTGLSIHTALFTDYARATGGSVLHVGTEYNQNGTAHLDGVRRVRWVELDLTVDERRTLTQARALLRGGSPSEAIHMLEAFRKRHTSDLLEATLEWAKANMDRSALRFEEAKHHLDQLVHRCRRTPDKRAPRWRALYECASHASKAISPLLDATHPHRLLHLAAEAVGLASHEEQAGRLNHAALLRYRAAEAAVAHRLLHKWKVDVDDGWRGEVPPDLGARFSDFHRRAHGHPVALQPRHPLGLFAGIVLLAALGDPLLPGHGDDDALLGFLRRFSDASRTRNRNILAHGFESMTKESLDEWTRLVERTDNAHCLLRILQAAEPRGEWGRAMSAHSIRHLSDDGRSASRS